jgi:hypothetical protein
VKLWELMTEFVIKGCLNMFLEAQTYVRHRSRKGRDGAR